MIPIDAAEDGIESFERIDAKAPATLKGSRQSAEES